VRKKVTIGFSPDEFLRVQGASAVAGVPVATYLKWLLQGGSPGDTLGRHMTTILERLDALSTGVAKLSVPPDVRPGLHAHTSVMPLRETLTAKLRQRGFPSSTIRQVTAVLDELEGCK
jgi:hypothetical protein